MSAKELKVETSSVVSGKSCTFLEEQPRIRSNKPLVFYEPAELWINPSSTLLHSGINTYFPSFTDRAVLCVGGVVSMKIQ